LPSSGLAQYTRANPEIEHIEGLSFHSKLHSAGAKDNEMIEYVGTLQGLDAAENCGLTGLDACHEKLVRIDSSMTHAVLELSLKKGDLPCQDR